MASETSKRPADAPVTWDLGVVDSATQGPHSGSLGGDRDGRTIEFVAELGAYPFGSRRSRSIRVLLLRVDGFLRIRLLMVDAAGTKRPVFLDLPKEHLTAIAAAVEAGEAMIADIHRTPRSPR